MSNLDDMTESDFGGWDADELIDQLTEEGGTDKVYHVKGVSGSAIQRDFSALRRRLLEQNFLVFGLDPTGTSGTSCSFRTIASEYASQVEQRSQLDEASRGLVDFLAKARNREVDSRGQALSGRVFKNAVCQLWKALSRQIPAILVVFHPDELSATEREIVEQLVGEFFADPVEEFAPEFGETNRVDGSLVFVRDADDIGLDLPDSLVEQIDVSGRAKASIREALSSENVVERFLASTGGDPERLDAIIESLPEDCQNFWEYRYEQLDGMARTVVELLAVAGEPLSVEHLERAVCQIEPGGGFSDQMRTLTDEGYVARKIEAGTVQFRLADSEFRDPLLERLSEERGRELHLSVALAGEEAQLQSVDDRFLAEHFLEAGDADKGFKYGMRAARRLHGEHALEEARELFVRLLEKVESPAETREIRTYLLDIHTALGNIDLALEQVAELKRTCEDEREEARLTSQEGDLLVQAADYEAACERFDAICEDFEGDVELEAGARLGRAEAAYLRGEHAEARRLAEEARAVIEAVEEDGELDRPEKRTLVQIRNLLGRLGLYRGDVDAAKPIFESNLALARELDWEGEVARAEVNLAVVDLQRGNFAAAADALEQLRLRTPGPKGDQRAALLINLGMAAQRKGKFADSLDYYRAAIREAKRVEYDEAIGAGAYNLATLMAEMGAYDEVGEIIERLEQRQLDQHRHMFLGALPQILRANLHIERGAYLEALETLENVDLGEGDQVSVEPAAKARLRSVQAHVGLGQIDHAKELLEGADFAEDIAPGGPVTGLEALAKASIALAEESWQEAADKAREAAEELREAGHFQDAARASVIRCRALMEDGRTGEASSYAGRRLSDFQHHAESIPEEFHAHFYSIPVYRELVELNRELTGDTTEPYDRYVEAEEAEEKESFDTDTEAFRRWRSRYGDIVGEDERLLKVFRRIDQVAVSDSPVLIQGESGTGKELIAEAIYQQGDHGEDDPFVKVNCGAFVDNLLLSELFGHEKGAFTGAVERKVGRFEKADGGVIFLDEIGEISQKAQVALLRVLQEGEFERVGGTETRSVDVRIICATNRDLESMVENGEFRLDLYYRLKGVLLELPPLRKRRQDIPRLVKHFAAQYADEEPIGFDRDVLEFLASYTWPGNIRELKNFVRSILLFVDGDTVEMEHLRGFRDFFSEGDVALEAPEIDYDVPVDDYEDVDPEEPVAAFDNAEDALVEEIVADGLDLAELKKRIEYQSICRALKETGGNITRAAEILKMTRPRLSQIVNSDDDLVALKERLVG